MYKYKHVPTGVIYTVEQDEYPRNPRKEYDNVGTMVCWHRRYNLGDVQPKCGPSDYMLSLLTDVIGVKCKEDANLMRVLKRHAVVLPLYLYDHSGITMATAPFSCPWDSGQVGFIYVLNSKAKKEWDVRYWRKPTRAYLEAEVSTYNAYISGNCYAWTDSNDESCGGYYYTGGSWLSFVADMISQPENELEEISDD